MPDEVKYTWLEPYSGGRVDLPAPRPDQIHILDIAHALGYQCRFNGHCDGFYSVAEHCILCLDIARLSMGGKDAVEPRLAVLILLHDAAEAYCGDLVRGVKDQLPEFRAVEAQILPVIYAHFALEGPTDREAAAIHRLDMKALATEAAALMPSGGADWDLPCQPHPTIKPLCLSPDEAYIAYRRELTAALEALHFAPPRFAEPETR